MPQISCPTLLSTVQSEAATPGIPLVPTLQMQEQGRTEPGWQARGLGWGMKVGMWRRWSLTVEAEKPWACQRRAVTWWKRLLGAPTEFWGKHSLSRNNSPYVCVCVQMLSSSKCLSRLKALQQQPQATAAPTAPCPVTQTPTQGNSTENSGLKRRHLRQNLIPSVQFPAYVFYLSAALCTRMGMSWVQAVYLQGIRSI